MVSREREAVIVSAVRTPIGSFMGSLKTVAATELGAIAIKDSLKKAGIPHDAVDEVIMGNVLQAGLGQNPARQAAIKAGLPIGVSSMTINKVCGSGLKALHLACQAIWLDEADVIVCGGMENMSQAPYLLDGARDGLRMGNAPMVDSMINDGLWCAFGDYHMGITAENLCETHSLSREELDEFAAESQRKCAEAQEQGKFNDEITAVEIPQRKGDPLIIDKDEYPKAGSTSEKLARLRPAFKKEGMVTAGNASGINDGAAALVVMSRKKAEELGLKPLAVVKANASAGVAPEVMGIGPVEAVQKVLKKTNMTIEDIDLIEANEAFASQSLAVGKDLGFVKEKLNVNGGAIALGHPIGASGARIVVTLLHEMKRRKSKSGLATLCIGGGQGVASVFENEEN